MQGEPRMDDERSEKSWGEDKPWSAADLFDLQNNVARGDLVEETADCLMRPRSEVREKIDELGLTRN
jgi:hypothetical protein